jgi:hypothetical protein
MIEDLKNIYKTKSLEWLGMAAPEYCRIAYTYFTQELTRSAEYYDLSLNTVRDTLINIIITDKYDQLCTNGQSGIWYQLSKQSLSELKVYYTLFKYCVIDKNIFYPPLKRISSILGDFITEEVKQILTKTRDGTSQDVINTTQEILDLAAYIENVVNNAFENDRDIGKESDHFLQQSLNKEQKCPITFAEYANFLLSKDLAQNAGEQDLDQKIDVFFKLINKIYDKDIFLNESRTLLARRLLDKPNIDTEKKFLGKMGTDWGLSDQSRMKNMLDDISTSETLTKEWEGSGANPGSLESFTVKVLRTSCWPDKLFQKDKQNKIFSDPAIEAYKSKFKTFYINKNQGKNLDWIVNHGSAELKLLTGSKPYQFLVNPIQMALLLLFNHQDKLSFGDMKDKLGFPDGNAHLTEAIRFFSLRSKLLSRDFEEAALTAEKNKEKKAVDDKENFWINAEFQSKMIKLNCIPNVGAVKKTEERKEEDLSEVMKEREFVIDAAIVRIMKSKKRTFSCRYTN